MRVDLTRLDHGRMRLVTTLVLFLGGIGILMLRNLDPLRYPVFYGEDGGWSGMMLNRGFWYTAFHYREFPILGDAMLIQAGLWLNLLLHGRNVVTIPETLPYVSWIFCALLAIAPFLMFRGFLSVPARLCLVAFTLLVPLGYDNNVVLGRILNLGFFFPVIAAYVVVWALLEPCQMRRQLACIATLVICVLTLPISLGFAAVYIVLYGVHLLTPKRMGCTPRWTWWLVPLLALAAMTVTLDFFPSNLLSDKGGADLPVKHSALIEFMLARILLFPLVATEYNHLTNNTVIVLAILLMCGMSWLLWLIWRRHLLPILPVLAAIGMAVGYVVVMAVQRRGLSFILDRYTMPTMGQYYAGIELTSFFVLIVLLDGASRLPRLRLLMLVGAAVLINLLFCTHLFEYRTPFAFWHEEGTLKDSFVREACPATSLFAAHPEYVDTIRADERNGPHEHYVVVYPILEGALKYAWSMRVPQSYFDHTVKALKIHCATLPVIRNPEPSLPSRP